MRTLRFLFLPLALVALPVAAHADEAEPAKDPQVVRLLDAKKTLKWNAAVNNSSDKYGHAEALVEASADVVAKKAAEFGQYKSLHKKFQSARVIAKDGDNTDVYMKYPVTIGYLTFEFSEVMRFQPTRSAGSSFVIEGRGIKGDMKTGHTIITVKPVDAKHSLLQVDVLLVPTLPAPQSLIDEELRDGAQDFVNGLKDKSQGWVGPVTSL